MTKKTRLFIFFAALLLRILYAAAVPAIYSNVDTEGYYALGMDLFSHPSLQTLITPYRTPVYGAFLNAVMHLVGFGGAVYASPAFLYGAQFVVAIQMIIGALACTLLCDALARFVSKRSLQLIAVFMLFDVFVIGWEHTLMSEGLAISVSVFITAVLLCILCAPTAKKFILLSCLFAFGFLLRPSFILYPISTLPVAAWYFRKQGRVVFLACAAFAAASLVPLAYAGLNSLQYGYYGIQFVGDINILGKILAYRIPVDSAQKYTYFYPKVAQSQKSPAIPTGFQFLQYYDPAIWGKMYRFTQLQSFNRTVIRNNILLYLVRAAGSVPDVLLEVCEFIRVSPSNPVWIFQKFYGYAQYATLTIPFLWVVLIIVFLMKPTRRNALLTLTGTIAMSQIVLTALVVYRDIGGQYGRILSVVRPHMFLFLLLCALTCLKSDILKNNERNRA